mgnify:CR=1 FL=1
MSLDLSSRTERGYRAMKIYTIIGGVNGCGKSSLTGALKAERRDLGIIIDVDKIAAEMGGNNLEAGKEAVKKIDECFSRGVCFTQETTLSGRKTEQTIKRARDLGYYIRLYYIGLNSEDECMQRIKNRVSKGGHDIPEADVSRRFRGRFHSLVKVLPYCDEVTLFDNDNGFVEVAEYVNGELIPRGDYRPRWLQELLQIVNS